MFTNVPAGEYEISVKDASSKTCLPYSWVGATPGTGKITSIAVDRLIDGKVEYFDVKERARQARLEREQEGEE